MNTDYLKKFDDCLEGERPYCVTECPFRLDQRKFMEKAKRGALKAAFKTYRDAVGFPNIASKLCDAPCMKACPMKDPVDILEIERASCALTKDQKPVDYNIPKKNGKIAIIGGGISGLGALLRLSTKKYDVTLFEKSDRIGGSVRDLVADEIFERDINDQLMYQEYELMLNTEIFEAEQLADFDAVYVATGRDGNDFGVKGSLNEYGEPDVKVIDGKAWFAGGELLGLKPSYALANGLWIGTVIDNYLKTGNPYYPDSRISSRMCDGVVDMSDEKKKIIPEGETYTKEEAAAEAGRCFDCKCEICVNKCDLLTYFKKGPLRIRDEVVATTLEGKTEIKATPAKRLMSLCSQCGLCEESCPEDVDMDTLFMVGRQKMHRQGKMPWAFHDFFLKDMAQANGEASLVRIPAGYEKSTYAFFPGCQLGASEPEEVVLAYESLTQQYPDTAIFLQCCGISASWAGDVDGYRAILDDIKEKWESIGKPTMIMACPTCIKEFKKNLPEIPVTSLYEIFAQWNIVGNCVHTEYSVFDACAARHEDGMKKAVRDIVTTMGADLTELPRNSEEARCCGVGGHGAIADPKYAEYIANERISEGDLPYITYCINCRDTFLSQGKDAVHVLDLLYKDFGEEEHMARAVRTPDECKNSLYTITERQQNRIDLKKTILNLFFDETMETEDNRFNLTLEMSDEVRRKLSSKRIFEDEVAETIDFLERTGRTVLNGETGTLTGYLQIGHATYWVEYLPLGDRHFKVVNAYSHRIKIELEAVWNGRRVEDDM